MALAWLRGSTDEPSVQFLCEDVDLAGQVGVGFQLELLSFKVVVGLGLLEGIPRSAGFGRVSLRQ